MLILCNLYKPMIKLDRLTTLTCDDCSKKPHCKESCIFIDKIAGNKKGCKELLPPPQPQLVDCCTCQDKYDCLGQCDKVNYNTKLANVQARKDATRKKTIGDIRKLGEVRLKAIMALIYAGFSVSDIPFIVELLDVKERRLYQIINEAKK